MQTKPTATPSVFFVRRPNTDMTKSAQIPVNLRFFDKTPALQLNGKRNAGGVWYGENDSDYVR